MGVGLEMISDGSAHASVYHSHIIVESYLIDNGIIYDPTLVIEVGSVHASAGPKRGPVLPHASIQVFGEAELEQLE